MMFQTLPECLFCEAHYVNLLSNYEQDGDTASLQNVNHLLSPDNGQCQNKVFQ